MTTPRLIVRREVLAFIALHGEEAMMPCRVGVREYTRDGEDWHTLDLDVDSEAAVRFWAKLFGHEERNFRRHTYTEQGWDIYSSHGTDWRGIWTSVTARIDHDAEPAPLPVDSIAALAALAGA